MKHARFISAAIGSALLLASSLAAAAGPEEPPQTDLTPPRLSFIEGQASFWRPGAEDWAPARVNTPLWPGDALYTGQRANLEIQVGARAFVRLAEETQLALVNLEPDLIQFQLTSGEASLDFRTLPAGQTVEIGTPNAAFTIEQPGYYRAAIIEDATHFTTRRGGRATITTADGQFRALSPSEEVVVRGIDAPTVESYVAPELDAWDRWNYARTDHEVEALSARYVSPGVYGVGALDHYGTWRVVPSYGTVWVPQGVAPGWAPYSTGSWIWDPFYGWTWVDDSPWGWAPFHYGRWVFVQDVWAWTPGPVIARPVYAPALVAFFGLGSGVSVRIGIGPSGVGWVPLGWGEPLRPWWGRPGFAGAPSWRGWGGPRVVNNVVISHTSVVNMDRIVYQNTKVSNAVMVLNDARFGKGPVRGARHAKLEPRELEPFHGAPPVKPGPASVVPETGKAVRPPDRALSRPVVATRAPREVRPPWNGEGQRGRSPVRIPGTRMVAPKGEPEASGTLPRPSFATDGPERPRPPLPQRYQDMRRSGTSSPKGPERTGRITDESVPRSAAAPGSSPRGSPEAPAQAETRRDERPAQEPRAAPSAGTPPAPRTDERSRDMRREGRAGQESRAASSVAAPPRPPSDDRQGDLRPEGRRAQQPRAAAPPAAAPEATERQRDLRREGRPRQESRALPGRPANEVYPGRTRGPAKARERDRREGDRQ